MRFITDYMRDEVLRHELNELTRETFGFDFESWVTNGYFEGDYIPYSYEEDGRMIANVSVNRMEFLQNGVEKHYIQVGTVMTGQAFRNQGYARKLMEKVLSDYAGKCDGIYLFGNLDALGFYDKMGFARGMQYRYILKSEIRAELQKLAAEQDETACFRQIEETDLQRKACYMETVRQSAVNSAFEQTNKYGLQMFYTAEMEPVYYCETLDCYISMYEEEGTLYLKSVIAKEKVSLKQILTHIRSEYTNLILGFTPCEEDAYMFDGEAYDGEDDYRLFIYGEELRSIEKDRLYFPEFSHA
ncbi:MAG: GNAT family N-acetyltransferase [Coprococcus sp.]